MKEIDVLRNVDGYFDLVIMHKFYRAESIPERRKEETHGKIDSIKKEKYRSSGLKINGNFLFR
ncbi:MAG: hypothetical protein QG610_1376 [Euryarchaeota archaeon]|nr:hypothetical protein [Euryarchaeota archaeon]